MQVLEGKQFCAITLGRKAKSKLIVAKQANISFLTNIRPDATGCDYQFQVQTL